MSSEPENIYIFERIEKKFMMSEEQYQALLPFLKAHLQKDLHDETTVCNIYYDTPDYALIRTSIERPPFKEKLRLRSYGIPSDSDPVFIEIKRKLNGIGYKRRISLPFAEAKKLLKGNAVTCDNPQIQAELLAFIERYHPKPMVYLTYRRYAMIDPENTQFRVTIDRDLQYRTTDPEAPSNDGMKPILKDPSMVLMEIKALGAIPLWFTEELNRLQIRQAPFSKIGTCYTHHIAGVISYASR